MGFQKSFKALSDPIRRDILALLRAGPMAAGDIAAHFQVSGATVSHHLSILRDAGLVLDDKQGKYIYYELNMSVVDEILEWVTALKGGDKHEKNRKSPNFCLDIGAGAAGTGRGGIQQATGADPNELGFRRRGGL